ncbi:head GIN domain-containing protein [Devosia sediminis]|uniref:DUF2807 domain-containing protein n=1 Tax=Devosia sediminis TaxID=2798801 RepID=A0A934ITB7_9HYPH|nr:head GIN domain-containing protein [Devosia sediminis]MBJ3783952.1 DUF2807 domain-containing protein [Devosia sediminis]
MAANKSLFAAGLISMALTATAEAQQRDFDFAGFDAIDIATGIDANVVQADQFSVRAHSASSDALDNLRLSVEGGVLTARFETSFLDFILSGGLVGMLFNSGNAVTLDISLPTLTSATASSGANVDIGALNGQSLSLEASSGSSVRLDAAALENLTVSASSGSDVEISGSAAHVRFDASSGSNIDAEDLEAQRGELQASSGSDINARLRTAVRANASSGADIDIAGNPAERDVDASSGGDISFDD